MNTIIATVTIPLSQGLSAIIDEADYERVSKYRWFAMKGYQGRWYAVRNRKANEGKRGLVCMHRWLINEERKTHEVHHKNDNGLDNRRENIESLTKPEHTVTKRKKLGRTGYHGVYVFNKRLFSTQIHVNGKYAWGAYFKTAEEAARAYDEKAIQLLGPSAELNFRSAS